MSVDETRNYHGGKRPKPETITEVKDPDITVSKEYFPQEKSIQIHQSRVQLCPSNFPASYYWYSSKRAGPGRPPKWVDHLMTTDQLLEVRGSSDEDNKNNDVEDNEPESEAVQTAPSTPDNDETIVPVATSGTRRTRTRTIVPLARYLSENA